MYAQAVESLLKTNHFLNKATESEKFHISEEDDKEQFVDINALSMTIQNMRSFLADSNNKTIMGNILYESKFVTLMVSIPEKICSWQIDRQLVGNIVVKTITYLCSESERVQLSFMHAVNINKLFDNLQLLGKPTHNLIEECLSFAFCVDERAINAAVVVKMIEWIGGMAEDEQEYLTSVLLKKSKLLESRRLMSDHHCIDKV